MKRTTLFIFMLMVLFTARGEAMSFPSSAPTYITNIGTAADWSEFCATVNGGYDYSGVEVRLTDDITEVSDIVGTASNCFKGSFDGQGHTITFSKTVTGNTQYTAPFGFIDGATIKNLKMTGMVTSGGRFAGGVVAYAKGISNVTNCINSTVITSTAYGTSNGGIVGMVGGAGTLTITGCVFNGEMHGTVTQDWCGILGLSNTNCNATIIDCLFSPVAVDEGLQGHTIYRQGNGGHASQSNCHYTQTMNNLEGTQVYSVTGGENVILAIDGDIINDYDVSGLSYYDTGFSFNDIIYAANGESLSINLSYYNLPEGPGVAYSADYGTLSGDSNPYTLEMAASNTTIRATVLPLRSSNGNYYSWEYFAAHPRDCGETIYLECDITVTTMVSGQSWNTSTAFNKTFNGQNHTITMAIDTTINEAALFRYTNNAFFRNLKLEGYIHSTSGNTASLIGLSQECVNIIDCHSNVTVSNADDQNGVAGFIAFASDIVRFYGCDFTGVLAGTSSEQNGGFVGRYTNGREHYYEDCVFAPSSISEQVTNGFTFDPYPSTNFHKNCYYTTPFGRPQGEPFYTITGDTDVTVEMDGEATEYTTSGITSYRGKNGLLYNGTIIVGADHYVWLNLSSEQSGYFYTDNVDLEGTSNPYWFTMPAEDVVVRIAPPVTITVTANPEEGGTVAGGGDFAVNDTCTLVARPNRGYAFINWTKDGVEVSSDTTYKFNVTENATFVANFEALDIYQITATANPALMGTVTGAGTYYDTEECTLVALPNTTYGFVNWTENGTVVSANATYIFTVDGDRTLVANFEKICDYYVDFEDIDNPSSAHDQVGPLPMGWNYSYRGSEETRPHVQNATTFPGKISGDNYLCFNAGSGFTDLGYAPNSYVIMPAFASNQAPKHLSFKYRFEDHDSGGTLTYGLITRTDIDTYIVLGTIQYPSSDLGIVDVDLNPEQTAGKRIAFRWNVEQSWFTCGIDDICVKFEAVKQFVNSTGDGKWETANNWYPFGAPHLTDDVTLYADVTIGTGVLAKANNITIASGHTLTIEDGGQLRHNNAGVTATVEKEIVSWTDVRDHYYLMALPFPTVSTYSSPLDVDAPAKYDLYAFDGSKAHKEWRWRPMDLANGQGFLYADSIPDMASRTLSLTGTLVPSNAPLSFNLTYTITPFGEWNLVGNPFACNATSSIDNFYVIDGTELVPASGTVAPLQGIFVKSTGSGQSVTFTPGTSSKAAQALNICLAKADSRDGRNIDLVRIRFDESEDLEKLQVNPSHIKIYIQQDSKDYAVVNMGRDGVHTVSTMPINFKATEDGRYTITIDPEGVDMAYLHLIDNLTDVDVDLLTNPSYTFTAKNTDDERRFKLVFSICEDAEGNDVKTKKQSSDKQTL